jgi:hypothetical protein
MSDPHLLDPDHLPTPFTADEIRAAAPDGYTVETVTEDADGTVTRQRTVFIDGDDEGTTMRAVAIDETGSPTGDERVGPAAWVDLQRHASFPAAATTRSRERIETPLGTLDCLCYEVQAGDATMVFWFSVDHPGMPVRYLRRVGSEITSTTTVTAVRAA